MPASQTLAALGCFALFAIVASPAAATTAVDGSITLEVLAKANANVQLDPFELQSWSTVGSHPKGLSDLGTIAFDPEAKSANGKIDVKAHGDLSAHWDSAESGSVTADVSRTIDLKNDARQMSLLINADWEYTFVADQDGMFNLDYMFSGDGKLKGLNHWSLDFKSSLDGQHFDEFGEFPLDRFFDGSLEHEAFALEAGRTYSVELSDLDQNRPDDGNDLTGGYHAQFNWSIVPDAAAPAPEPASWLLMIMGFGLAGGMVRRRRMSAI